MWDFAFQMDHRVDSKIRRFSIDTLTGSKARSSRRTPLTGSALIRLLAALNDAYTPAPKESFVDGLCRWFDWTDAISLSAALECSPAVPAEAGSRSGSASADEREYRRVRSALAKLVAPAPATTTDRGRPSPPAPAQSAPADAASGFAPHRQRYLSWQQAMDANIAPLRRRVRATLAGASPAMARLASLDAVMEQVVGPRERALLSTVPSWLEQHFKHLRQAHADAPLPDAAPMPGEPAEWLNTFCQDMRDVLLAELDLRMQPVEGLLEALHGPSPDHHE